MRSYVKNAKRGFTLAELLIVVAIVLVLVAIAIPVFTGSLSKAQEATCAANRKSLHDQLVVIYLATGKLDATNAPDTSEYTCPSGGEISYTQEGDVITVSCSVHVDSGSVAGDTTEAGTQAKSFTEFMEQWLATPGNTLKNKGALYAAYYAEHSVVQMSDEYAEKLKSASSFNSSLKDDTFYWWNYPVTDNQGNVLYTVTYANTRSNPADWTSDQRGKMSAGYVVMVNGKTYYRGQSGSTVEPGNMTGAYPTEDALEKRLQECGYLALDES